MNNFIANCSYWSTRFQIQQLAIYNGGKITTGRPFSYYRKVFFDDQTSQAVFASLKGKKVIDIGCGYSPYSEESMFRACHNEGIDFYGVDPVIRQNITFKAKDVLLTSLTGGTGHYDINAPGLERALSANADDLPFSDNTIDMVLSCWFIPIWIDTEEELFADLEELYRILKVGGTINLYPSPDCDSLTFNNQKVRSLLDKFNFSERFIFEPFDFMYPPTNQLILTKIS